MPGSCAVAEGATKINAITNRKTVRVFMLDLRVAYETVRQPGDLGSFVALKRRGGSEDPWLCAPVFWLVCLYQPHSFIQTLKSGQFWDIPKSEVI